MVFAKVLLEKERDYKDNDDIRISEVDFSSPVDLAIPVVRDYLEKIEAYVTSHKQIFISDFTNQARSKNCVVYGQNMYVVFKFIHAYNWKHWRSDIESEIEISMVEMKDVEHVF